MSYCIWGNASAVTLRYHDEEWGLPVRDDRRQFECLMMEVMQCGLSWDLMMKKREIFRRCFDRFDFKKIAVYGKKDIARVLATDGMFRSRRKVEAIIHNARYFRALRKEHGTFSSWTWSFTDGKTVLYDKHGDGLIPASNGPSDRISSALRKRGFKYLGPVTAYLCGCVPVSQTSGIISAEEINCK